MLLVPVSLMKQRLAKAWVKERNLQGPFVYKVSDRRVIDNKPHVVLRRWIDPRQMESGHGAG